MKLRKKRGLSLVLMFVLITTVILPYNMTYALPSSLPGARSVTVNGDVYLGGNYVEIGIDNNGWFGASEAAPAGFHPVSRTNIGMVMDADGFNVNNAMTNGDFFLPGSPAEGYGIGYKETDGGVSVIRRNVNPSLNGAFNQNMSLVDLSSGDTLSALHTVDDGKLKVQQKVTLNKDDIFFKLEVTLTNITASTLYDVRYFRVLDPDQDLDYNSTFNTLNKVDQNPPTSSKALVYSKGPVTGTPFFYVAFDSTARANIGSTSDPYNIAMYNPDGDAMLTAETNQDTLIGMTFAKGNLNAGESAQIVLYCSLDPDLTGSLTNIENDVASAPELTALSLNNASLNPAFSSSQETYEAILPVGTTTTNVTPVATSGSSITVSGVSVTSGSASGDIALSPGDNTIPIVVVNGAETKNYSINAIVASNQLSSLTLNSGDLSPAFNASTESYSVNYPSGTLNTTITPVTVTSGASIKINSVSSPSGTPYTVPLTTGANNIAIEVTAEDSSVKTYTVNAIVAAAVIDPELTGLSITDGTLSPVFSSSQVTYDVILPVGTTTTRVTPVATSGSSIKVNNINVNSGSASGDIALTPGDNQITVLVDNGLTTKQYLINAVVASDKLAGLTLSSTTLSPVFDPTTENYTASFTAGTATTSVTATSATAGANIKINGASVTSGTAHAVSLTRGANTITVQVTAEDNSVKTYSVLATVEREKSESGGGGGVTSTTPTTPTDEGSEVIVNGQVAKAGEESATEENGKKVLTLVVNTETIDTMIEEALAKINENPNPATKPQNTVKIKTSQGTSDQVLVKLTGDIVKKMDENQFVISIETPKANYLLPAEEVNILEVAKLFESESNLRNIVIDIKVNNLDENALVEAKALVENNGSTKMLIAPLEFKIIATASDTDESVELKTFKTYVAREIPVTDNTLGDITTGVLIFNNKMYHIPTRVISKGAEVFVSVKSLTNSTYTVIYNPITVEAVRGHWSEAQVNNMASRLVLRDFESFKPDQKITRAEFADYITNALGLIEPKTSENFGDIQADNIYYQSIQVARDYDLFSGDEKGYFNPDQLITREEAMVVSAKALVLAGIQSTTNDDHIKFVDADDISPWAVKTVAFLQDKNVIKGNDKNEVKPKENLTCAEAISIVENLLISADLIE